MCMTVKYHSSVSVSFPYQSMQNQPGHGSLPIPSVFAYFCILCLLYSALHQLASAKIPGNHFGPGDFSFCISTLFAHFRDLPDSVRINPDTSIYNCGSSPHDAGSHPRSLLLFLPSFPHSFRTCHRDDLHSPVTEGLWILHRSYVPSRAAAPDSRASGTALTGCR